MPTKIIIAPPPASSQPTIDLPLKKSSPMPMTSGISVNPNVFVPHQCQYPLVTWT